MSEIKFFTPIYYGAEAKTGTEKALQNIDNYFHICGKKAVVINPTHKGQEELVLRKSKFSGTKFLKAMGIALSYFTVVIPLTLLISKAILRSSKKYTVIDPKQELEKGINLPQSSIEKIQSMVPTILRREKTDDIEYINGSKIFRLKEYPNFVFKMGVASGSQVLKGGKLLNDKESMENRFENMIKAKQVCLINKLGLLEIPHAKMINFTTKEGQQGVIIAEESKDINPKDSAQVEFYHTYSKELNETARQLATFIAKTGFCDVAPRNIPIINEAKDYKGPRRVALIDLEDMDSARSGFTGDINGSLGLIGCVSEAQVDIVIDEARKNGLKVNDSLFVEAKRRRLNVIESEKDLQQFYKNKGIVHGKEPIQVDIDTLGLDLTEEGKISAPEIINDKLEYRKKMVTLRNAVEDIVAEINRQIQKKSDQESIKGKRYILLNTNEHPFSDYNHLGLSSEVITKELWLHKIINALVEKGYLFKLVNSNGHGLFIQA